MLYYDNSADVGGLFEFGELVGGLEDCAVFVVNEACLPPTVEHALGVPVESVFVLLCAPPEKSVHAIAVFVEHGYEVGGVFCLSGFGLRVFFADVGVFCATHFPALGVACFHNHDFTVGHLHFHLRSHPRGKCREHTSYRTSERFAAFRLVGSS